MASSVLLLLQLLLLASLASASHHYGGSLTFTYKGRNPDGSLKVALRTRDTYDGCQYFHYWYCYSGNCGYAVTRSINTIDSSTNAPQYNRQWCETENLETWILSSDKPFQLRAASCCWIPTRNSVINWNFNSLVDLGRRSDTGQPNRSPDIAILPFIRIPQNCPRTYRLASFDPDGDRVQCRYGNINGIECDNCHPIPGFQLDQDTCTLHYQYASASAAVFGFQMVVEDYSRGQIDLFYSDGSRIRKYPLLARRKRQATSTTPSTSTTTVTAPWWWWHSTTTAAPTTTAPWWWWHSTTTAAPTTTAPWWWWHSTTTAAPRTTAPWWWWTTTTTAAPRTTAPWWWWTTTTAATPTTTAPTTTTPTTTTPWWWWWTTTTTATPTTTAPWWWWTTTTAATPTTTVPTTTTPTTTTPWWWWWTTTTTATPTTTTPTTTTPTTTTPWWWWWTTTTTATPTTTAPTTTTPTTTTPWWWWWTTTTTAAPTTTTPTTTTAAQYTSQYTSSSPLSQLPLQFSFLVDPPVPTCQEGLYLPVLVSPTPANGQRITAEVHKEVEIRVAAQASYSIIQNIIMSGPTNITKHRTTNNEFIIKWTPIADDLGDHYPLCFAVESVAGSYVYQSEMRCVIMEVRKEQIAATVTCTETTMKVEVERGSFFGLREDHLRLSDPTNTICNLRRYSNRTHITALIPLNACGTQIEEDDDYLIFKNEISTVDDAPNELITRKHLVEARFYCQYPKRGNVTLGFTAHRKNVTVWEKGFGTFTYQFEFYPDNQFRTMISPNSYPLDYDVGERIYMQIDASASINNTEMFVESCRAAPYDNPNYHPTYAIIENGCTVDPTVQIHSSSNDRQFRFSMEAFQFIGLHDQVYISCTVMMCEAGNSNTRCSHGCRNSTWSNSQSFRHKREAIIQSGMHFVSQGPLRLKRSADAGGLVNLNLNMVFIAGCLLAAVGMICGVLLYKAKMSKVKYQPLPLDES